MQTRSIFLRTLIWIFLAVSLAGCCAYSFTGGSTGNAKTVFIDYFPNKAPIINPALSQSFTEKLKDKFLRETRLTQVQTNDADFAFTGYISGYSVAPASVQGNAEATVNRLTITVNVKFENKLEPKQNFEMQFSQFSDFNASASLSQVEAQKINEIGDKLVQEIFNRTVNNW